MIRHLEIPTTDWELDCLSHDPFAWDYDGSCYSDRVLSDKIVTVRKSMPAGCHHCAGDIPRDMRARKRVEVYDGELMTFAWCQPCCETMAKDDGDAMEKRFALRPTLGTLQ